MDERDVVFVGIHLFVLKDGLTFVHDDATADTTGARDVRGRAFHPHVLSHRASARGHEPRDCRARPSDVQVRLLCWTRDGTAGPTGGGAVSSQHQCVE